MEVPLSWERLLWSHRGLLPPWERYVLTDFRLVRLGRHESDELAIQDIADVQHREAWIDRVLGSSTVVVHSRNHRRAPLVLPHVRHGAQLAALLDLTSAEPTVRWDQQSVRAALKWNPRTPVAGYREAALSVLTMLLTVFVVAVSMHGKAAAVVYPSNDAIYPNGEKKDRATIVRFMETDVLPWAQAALGPIKGGRDKVTCETCHGRDAQAREWQMPAVARLPQPEVTSRGWEIYSSGMDTQMRNAIYGYSADTDKQNKAAYMREIVMPGMARLLHRPAYDFTQPYEYNRTQFAFGCYHCHRVS
jgi:cytochrome c553